MNTELIRVAIADDHTITRKGIIEIIRSFGHFEIVIEAADGVELVAALENAAILPDICLLDINMPVMNGFETAAIISSRWPEMRLLALSMYTHEQAMVQMKANGADGYLHKDMHPEDLKRALLKVRSGSLYTELCPLRETGSTNLSAQEYKFLKYCVTGMSFTEIAVVMGISHDMAKYYSRELFKKMRVKTFPGLVTAAVEMGLSAPAMTHSY